MQSAVTIRLPFRMRIADGISFVSDYGNWQFKITFHHWDLAITGVGWFGEPLPVTVVNIIADNETYENMEHPLPNEIVRDFFLNTLSYLNRIIDTYRVAERDYSVRNVFLGDLPPILHVLFEDYNYGYLVNIPHWIALDVKKDKDESSLSVGSILATWEKLPQLMMVKRFYASANNYFEQGDNFRAIVDLETAFEIQVRLSFGMILHKNQVSDEERNRLLKVPLRNLIETHFAKHLGGNFSFNKAGPVQEWYQKLYLLRNECLHEGNFYISGEQASFAFEAYYNVEKYIGEKLIEKGFLKPDGSIQWETYIPQREIEVHEEAVKERLIRAGFIPDDSKFIRRTENFKQGEAAN